MPKSQLHLIKTIPDFFLDGLGIGFKLVEASTGKILLANNLLCQKLGYTRDEFLSGATTLDDITHVEDRSKNLSQHRLLINGKLDQYTVNKRYVKKNGSIFWGHINCAAVRDETGTVRWTTCTIEDVTDQVVIQNQLEIAKKLSGFATWIWQVENDSTEISKNYNAVFGLPDKSRSPSMEDFLKRVHPDDLRIVRGSIKRALAGGSYSHEYRLVLLSGEIRWMRGMAKGVVDANGKVVTLIGATIDITKEKSRDNIELLPAYIRLAIEYLEENWSKPIKNADLVRRTGKSSRALFKYFQSRNTSPGQYLRKIRLRHAREMLTAANAQTTVTGVALKCRFQNSGHFSRYYREEFGELPSETLLKSRA